jgi:hypothetical protein
VFLWATLAFFATQFTAGIALDYTWPQVRFRKFFDQVARVDSLPTAPTVVCLGSSRFGCGLDEAEMTLQLRELTGDATAQVFNAACPASDLVVAERMLGHLLDRGVRPQAVVIEVCPEWLNRRNGWLHLHVARSLRWDDAPSYLWELAATSNLPRFATTRLVPLYAFRAKIRDAVREAVFGWDPEAETASSYAGWLVQRGPLPEPVHAGAGEKWQRMVTEALEERPTGLYVATTVGLEETRRFLQCYRPGGNAVATLDRMLSRCRAEGIEPILLGIPLTSAHRACYSPEVLASYRGCVSRLTRRYDCRFADFLDALPDRQFLDHHHASAAGRRVLGRKLGIEILAPSLVEGHTASRRESLAHR